MPDPTTDAALAALQYWIAQVVPREQTELVRRAAWLVCGKQKLADGWPQRENGKPLLSIFSRVQPREGDAPAPTTYIGCAALALTQEVLFPISDEKAVRGGKELTAALTQAAQEIAQQNLPAQAQVEALLYALQRYAWCLPSPLEAVSLYDFARTHAAVAAALASQQDAAGDLFLLGGDLSGVQAFLYTLTAEGATKSLRGRSFYLQLLTDACARWILRHAKLPLSNLLYAGGGRFYILLPATLDGEAAQQWLTTQRAKLDAFFLYRHQGELYLALGGGPVQQADLLDKEKFRTAWGAATEAINQAKRRRFSDGGTAMLAQVFAPQGHGGDEESACTVCGYQGDAQEMEPIAGDLRGRKRCKLCDSFDELGRMLHNAEYMLFHHLERAMPQYKAYQRAGWQELLSELGLHVQIKGKKAHCGDRGNDNPTHPVRWTTALALDDEALQHPPSLQAPVVYGMRPMANTTPTMTKADLDDWEAQEEGEQKPEEGSVKTFNVMVAQSRGVKRLGVLRMDVDDLGDLFRDRLDSGLARVSSLSAALSLFFEGWVGQLCEQTNREAKRGSVYCIYSGGDDLFIVGSWHLMPELARRISDDLFKYTGQHPLVHISAGISLHGKKFPLYQAAEAAEKELKRAKERKGKAAIGWLEQVVTWASFDEVYELQQRFVTLVDEQHIPQALLQTCQQLYIQYQASLRKGKLFYGPWLWRGAYQLARIERALKDDHPAKVDIGAIRNHFTPDNDNSAKADIRAIRKQLIRDVEAPPNEGLRYIERLGLAARWTQLELRKEQGDGARD